MQIRSIEDISRTRYLNSLPELVSGFGMKGVFVKYHIEQDNRDKFYFVTGSDNSKIDAPNINPEALLEAQTYSKDILNPHIKVFEIKDTRDAFYHFQEVALYARNTEFANKVARHFGRKTPSVIDLDSFYKLAKFYEGSRDPKLTEDQRDQCMDMFLAKSRECDKTQAFQTVTLESGEQAYIVERAAPIKRKGFGPLFPHPQEKSLEWLTAQGGSLACIGVREKDAEAFERELHKHSHIPYHRSGIIRLEGREDNCVYTVPDVYKKLVSNIASQIGNPQYYCSPEDFAKKDFPYKNVIKVSSASLATERMVSFAQYHAVETFLCPGFRADNEKGVSYIGLCSNSTDGIQRTLDYAAERLSKDHFGKDFATRKEEYLRELELDQFRKYLRRETAKVMGEPNPDKIIIQQTPEKLELMMIASGHASYARPMPEEPEKPIEKDNDWEDIPY